MSFLSALSLSSVDGFVLQPLSYFLRVFGLEFYKWDFLILPRSLRG
jgi:hypothetical protein